MEIGAISQFLAESGHPNHLDRRLKPPCVFIDGHIELVVYIHDGELFLENWILDTKFGSNILIVQCSLADPDSFDRLLSAINEQIQNRVG